MIGLILYSLTYFKDFSSNGYRKSIFDLTNTGMFIEFSYVSDEGKLIFFAVLVFSYLF